MLRARVVVAGVGRLVQDSGDGQRQEGQATGWPRPKMPMMNAIPIQGGVFRLRLRASGTRAKGGG